MTGRLAGRVAIITGASRGLGRLAALAYAAEGATVIVTARSSDTCGAEGTIEEVARHIAATGGSALAVACDVADPASVGAMIGAVLAQYGRIDVLMANAGFFAPGTISAMAPSDWETQFRVNVHGVFYVIRGVLPTMVAQEAGTILAISSIAAQRPSHYGVTKRAVESMVEAFAQEQRAHGICVASLRPVAAIETPGWLAARDAATRQTRAHRISPPDSYVEAAVLLAARAGPAHSGCHFTDADVLRTFGGEEAVARYRRINAAVWSAASSLDA